jgi:hypothetical protein
VETEVRPTSSSAFHQPQAVPGAGPQVELAQQHSTGVEAQVQSLTEVLGSQYGIRED